jgi:hypothetical protein
VRLTAKGKKRPHLEIHEKNKRDAFETAKLYSFKKIYLVEIMLNGEQIAINSYGSKFKWKEGHGI